MKPLLILARTSCGALLVAGSVLGLGNALAADLPPEYLRAFGHLLTVERGVRWIEEICREQVPESGAAVEAAYAEWSLRHAALVNEVEQTIPDLDVRNQALPPAERGMSGDQFNALSEKAHQQVRRQTVAAGPDAVKTMCANYPDWTRSAKADFETSHADLVAVMRQYRPK